MAWRHYKCSDKRNNGSLLIHDNCHFNNTLIMKKTIALSVFLFWGTSYSQIIISPYILYTDTKNKFGTFLVLNESDQVYEIDMSFIFGYPVTDSVGRKGAGLKRECPCCRSHSCKSSNRPR